MDDLITNVMLYWFSGSITSAFMLYYNTLCGGDVLEVDAAVLDKPAAFTCGHYELGWTPEYYFREKHTNTRFHEVVNEGGHFFAMEQPAFLAKAIRKHFAQDDIRGLL